MQLLIVLCLTAWHPLYVTTFEISIGAKNEWQAKARFFYDDLEDGIQNDTKKRPNLSLQPENCVNEIALYLQSHFSINYSNDGATIPFEIDKIGKQNDVIEIFIKGRKPWPNQQVEIFNDVLIDIFHSQKNIVIVTQKNNVSSYYLHRSKTNVVHAL